MIAIRDSLSDLACSNNVDDGEDEKNQDTELGKLSEDDEAGYVVGTISKTVQQRMEWFRLKKMKLDGFTQQGGGDAANNFCEGDRNDGTTDLKVPAVAKLQMDDIAATPPPTTFGELMESLDIIPGLSQMPQGTSWPGRSDMRLRSGKPQSNKRRVS